MAFRGGKIRVEAAPVKDACVPVVWLGQRMIGCFEDQPTEAKALEVARWHAREWFRREAGIHTQQRFA